MPKLATIYHNPRCSKSRAALELLQSRNIEVEVKLYLKTPPSASELQHLISILDAPMEDILRTNEAEFKESHKDGSLSEGQIVELLTNLPKLLQRPIVVVEDRAVIGRPPENVLELLD